MPHEMFADAVVRPISPRARARRRRLVFVSIALHVVLVLALVFAQALAPGVLPAPARTLAFEITEPVKVVDVPAPPRP
ncbi:MAG TPA: hypothetical protein VEU08_14945, partial [Vicinamibacterales bacterium]|nr:hypothetical protein [Vicinamibacterales bacterium]